MASGQTQAHRNSISTQPSSVVPLAALYLFGTVKWKCLTN